MKIFPVFTKKLIVNSGDSDLDIQAGNQNHLLTQSISGAIPLSAGNSMSNHVRLHQATSIFPLGTNSGQMSQSDSGSGSRSAGTNSGIMSQSLTAIRSLSGGINNTSQSANSTITGRDAATTLSRVDINPVGGNATWTNPTNAQLEDTTLATITLTGQALSAQDFSDELRAQTFTPALIPSGWTLSTVNIRVVHRWQTANPVLDLTSTCNYAIVARYTDATEDTIFTLTQASADQATLIASTLNISTRIITEGKILDRVMLRAVANISLGATGTTKSWNVDSAQLEYIFTRTGIN